MNTDMSQNLIFRKCIGKRRPAKQLQGRFQFSETGFFYLSDKVHALPEYDLLQVFAVSSEYKPPRTTE